MNTLDDLIRDQEAAFLARTPRSQAMWEEACDVMPGGVTSSWASTRPIPVWIERGHGSHVWDVDGNEYVDYHAGYGVNVVGHGNPHVVDAVQRRVTRAPTSPSRRPTRSTSPRMLGDRFGLPQWRFTNSRHGSDDGRRAPRAGDHRPRPDRQDRGQLPRPSRSCSTSRCGATSTNSARSRARTACSGAGIPQVIADLVRIVPFNDLAAVERVFAAEGDRIAAMIVEPMMMNAGIIPPAPGYLEGLRDDHASPRCAVDLRRGQDRARRRLRWSDRAVRRHARHHLPGQGARAAACRAARSVAPTR